jgi:signal transduction histidine kinase
MARERVAELKRANDVIRAALDELRTREPDSFVRFAVLEVARLTGAAAAQVFRFSGNPDQLRQICSVRDGEVFPNGRPDDPEQFRSGFDADATSAYQRFLRDRGVVWSSTDPAHPDGWTFMGSWHQQMKHRSYAVIALSAGGRQRGLVGLAFTSRRRLSGTQAQVAVAISLQISLALEITDLAEQLEHTARAQHNEKAERERATELSRANGALRRSVERLASHPAPTTRAYLDAVLLEASLATGARVASLHQVDDSGQWLWVTACTIDNQAVDLGTDPRMAAFRPPVPAAAMKGSALTQTSQPSWVDIETEAQRLWPFTIPWHQDLGHKTLAIFPLLIAGRVIGVFALCFTTVERPTTPREELCSTLSQHAALAIELNRLSEEAKRAAVQAEQEKAARDLATELSNAHSAVAREIHDTLAQSFTGVLVQLQALDQSRVGNNQLGLERHLQNATSIARKGLAEAQRSVRALRPTELESESLAGALKLVARLAEQQSGVSVVVHHEVGSGFQPEHAAEILRIVQEAITNAVKHAHATLITVAGHSELGCRQVSVTDNGVGFMPERKTEGFGLLGMRERAAKIGGELRVTSGPDGTSIALRIPSSAHR